MESESQRTRGWDARESRPAIPEVAKQSVVQQVDIIALKLLVRREVGRGSDGNHHGLKLDLLEGGAHSAVLWHI